MEGRPRTWRTPRFRTHKYLLPAHPWSPLSNWSLLCRKRRKIPDFNTVFYDRETKRIVKRTKRKIETRGLPGKMITDTPVVFGKDQEPRFTIRARAALIHASEDNVDKIMTYLEQSKKSSAQLKDTL